MEVLLSLCVYIMNAWGKRMDFVECFQVLGIQPTKDERAIKNAYRERLAVTNPEDDPEGFKRLRSALEAANQYASMEDAEETEEEEDTTPSGLWVQQVAAIYRNIRTRCDREAWERLFEEDVFVSLEEEENCRTKLLLFLMEHYRLPTEIWRLLDEKLHITEDAEILTEQFHVDFISYIAGKCERGEDLEFGNFTGEEEAPYDQFLLYYDRAWRAVETGDLKQAEELVGSGDQLGITHPAMEICRAQIYEKQGDTQRAMELLTNLYERFSKDSMVGYNAAELLWRNHRRAEAAAIYQALKEELDSHYMANVRLTEWYYEQKDYTTAKKCAEKVLPSGADDAFMELLNKVNLELEKTLEVQYLEEHDWEAGMELGWCYLQDGKLHRGIRIAKEIAERVSPERDAEYKGLLAKLYIEETEYEQALEMAEVWEKALEQKLLRDETEEEREKDEDRVRQSHMIRMECHRMIAHSTDALQKGESRLHFEAAIEETKYMETRSLKDIGMLLEKAQVYMEMEEYEQSLEVCRILIERYRIYAAFATELEVYRKKWDAGGVIQAGRQCLNAFPNYMKAYEFMAKVYLDLGRGDDLRAVLKDAEQNGVKSVILDAYGYQLEHEIPDTDVLNQRVKEFRKNYLRKVDEGYLSSYEVGLPVITEYLYWYPGVYMLVERGIFHRAAHRLQEAQADFEKALGENPYHPYALNNLSVVHKYRGEYDSALVCVKKALRFREEEMLPGLYADLAKIYSLLGDHEEALKTYEIYRSHCDAKRRRASEDTYATYLVRCGRVQDAEKALLLKHGSKSADFYMDMVDKFQQTGMERQSWEYLKEWNLLIKAEEGRLYRSLTGRTEVTGWMAAQYFQRKAWNYLLFGAPEQAAAYFRKMADNIKGEKDSEGKLADAIFGCILSGDEKHGRKYAGLLQGWLQMQKHSSVSKYYDMQKAFLQIRFFAGYYTQSDEVLSTIVAEEERAEICYFCDYAICKEMEAVRILYLLKTGRRTEAGERLARNLKTQPCDEYMLALRRYLDRI